MDKQFLEFWGNMMLSASKGQQQLEDLMKLMAGNVKEYQELYGMFSRMYGTEQAPEFLTLWQKAINEFKDSYAEMLAMMDLVPRKDYISISRENQDLKRRVVELEEAVRHLRAMLDQKVMAPAEGLRGFQELIDDQARQYQEFMKSVTSVFEKRSTAAGTQSNPVKSRQKAKQAGRSGSAGGKK